MPRSWAELLGEEDAAPEPEGDRAGLFSRLRDSLSKSRRALAEQIQVAAFDPGDDLAWERLEEALLQADVGVRAAAEEQLEIWAERAGADFVGSDRGADPAAVAFDAIAAAQARGRDVVIVDTAGRLHTQTNLMEELAKVRRVIAAKLDGAPHETLLVVDATTGQNGVQQARLFGETVGVTGVALTKLDGSAKGGVALPIAYELGLPVKLIGVGEGLDDLRPFDPKDFARALLSG